MTDKTVPAFVEEDGERIQVGWATPDDNGVRSINLFEQFNNASIKNIKFGDQEPFETELDPATTQAPPRTYEEFASEPFVDVQGDVLAPPLGSIDVVEETPVPEAPVEVEPETPVIDEPVEEESLPAEPIEDAPDEEEAAEPIDAGVDPEDSAPIEHDPEIPVTELEVHDQDGNLVTPDDVEEVVEAELEEDDESNSEEVVDDTPYDDHQDH